MTQNRFGYDKYKVKFFCKTSVHVYLSIQNSQLLTLINLKNKDNQYTSKIFQSLSVKST